MYILRILAMKFQATLTWTWTSLNREKDDSVESLSVSFLFAMTSLSSEFYSKYSVNCFWMEFWISINVRFKHPVAKCSTFIQQEAISCTLIMLKSFLRRKFKEVFWYAVEFLEPEAVLCFSISFLLCNFLEFLL